METILNAFYLFVTVLFLYGTWELVKLLREVRDILEEIRDFLAELKKEDL